MGKYFSFSVKCSLILRILWGTIVLRIGTALYFNLSTVTVKTKQHKRDDTVIPYIPIHIPTAPRCRPQSVTCTTHVVWHDMSLGIPMFSLFPRQEVPRWDYAVLRYTDIKAK